MSSEFKICPDCFYENDANEIYCSNCGADLQKHSDDEFDISVFYNIDDLIDDALLVFEGENYQQSLELIDEYLQLDKDDDYVWVFKSHILNKLGYINDAITCCDIALNIDEMCEIAWISKAYHLNSIEKYSEALSCCKAALLLDSQNEFTSNLMETITHKNDSEVL